MRALVLALALLAGLKVWTQESLYRSGAEEALIAAYRERAIKACQRDVQRDALGNPLAATTVDWSRLASLTMVIGNKGLDVAIWEVDHTLWNARYRHPYLQLAAESRHWPVVCQYDVLAGTAALASS